MRILVCHDLFLKEIQDEAVLFSIFVFAAKPATFKSRFEDFDAFVIEVHLTYRNIVFLRAPSVGLRIVPGLFVRKQVHYSLCFSPTADLQVTSRFYINQGL